MFTIKFGKTKLVCCIHLKFIRQKLTGFHSGFCNIFIFNPNIFENNLDIREKLRLFKIQCPKSANLISAFEASAKFVLFIILQKQSPRGVL